MKYRKQIDITLKGVKLFTQILPQPVVELFGRFYHSAQKEIYRILLGLHPLSFPLCTDSL